MRIFMQNTQTAPQNKHFPPWNLEYCVSGKSLSYFRSGKEPAFGKNAQSAVVLVHSQVAIKALIKCNVTSIRVFNCIRSLNQLGKPNHVSIVWIPRHTGVYGNEVAGYLAKSGSRSNIHGPEPLLQSRMPVVLALLGTGPQMDGNLYGMN